MQMWSQGRLVLSVALKSRVKCKAATESQTDFRSPQRLVSVGPVQDIPS